MKATPRALRSTPVTNRLGRIFLASCAIVTGSLSLPFCSPTSAGASEFISGADFSHLGFFEQNGVVYKELGQPKDALQILKDQGLNCVRLRLFTSSPAQAQSNPYNYINNLDYTIPLAVRVKNAGLKVMLDFHYSDSWADPGKQTKPSAWTNLAFADLVGEMRRYNSNCIAAFRAAGAMPEYVQVGNEVIGGLLWPDGRVGGSYDTPTQWAKLGQLMKSAIQGILDASGAAPPAIIVHIDRGANWAGTQWFFDKLRLQQVPFDIIGQSYYPFWHGTTNELRTCLLNTGARYGKPVLVAETAFPWANSTNIHGIPATPEGQVQYLAALAKIVKSVPNGLGAGIVWWGAEYQAIPGHGLAGFHYRSFWGSDGDALPIVNALGKLLAPLQIETKTALDRLTLEWPLSGAAHTVTQSSNLTTWTPVTNASRSNGAMFGVDLPPPTNRTQFYRLQKN